jgi:hypothetical protein
LDALSERLRDTRVKRVIQAIITGDANTPLGRTEHDVALTMDWGLINWDKVKGFVIVNPVYE